MNIWLIAGYAGSGKTTVGELLAKKLSAGLTAFAKEVKNQLATQLRDWMDTQEGKARQINLRQLLIDFSADKKEETGEAVWAEYVAKEIEIAQSFDQKNWVIHDWRYVVELEVMRQRFPHARIHTVRVVSNRVSPAPDHVVSEHNLDDSTVDTVLSNNGTLEDLEKALDGIIQVTVTTHTHHTRSLA